MLEADGWRLVVTEASHRSSSTAQKPVVSAVIQEMTCPKELLPRLCDKQDSNDQAMKKLQYLVRISKDPDSDWGASVSDLPGCVATGKTIDSALRRIQGAITLHLRGLRKDGIRPPLPRHRLVAPKRTPLVVDFYATVQVAA